MDPLQRNGAVKPVYGKPLLFFNLILMFFLPFLQNKRSGLCYDTFAAGNGGKGEMKDESLYH